MSQVSSKKSWTSPELSVSHMNQAKAQQVGQPFDSSYGYTSGGVLVQLLHS